MNISGNAVLTAPPGEVWAALTDPTVLASCLPGCDELRMVGPDEYRMSIRAGVASIKGTFDGKVALRDQNPPSSLRLEASGAGGPGTIAADVDISLSPHGVGETLLTYDADAAVGGVIMSVGHRMLGSVANRMATDFFSAVDQHFVSGPASAPTTAHSAETQPPSHPVPVLPGRNQERQAGAMPPASVAFVLGGAVALVGVVVGALLRRPHREVSPTWR